MVLPEKSTQPTSASELNDHELAAALAAAAGRLLLAVRNDLLAAGASERELRATGDAQSNEFLLSRLTEFRPDDAILSEEDLESHGKDRLEAERVWIIDPLDGTREFGEGDRADWAVHVAMCVNGEPVVGAVGLPAQGQLLTTSPAPLIRPEPPERPRLLVSRTRPGSETDDLVDGLNAELVPMGSAGAKVAAVILGAGDIYAHSGGQYEWDSAAPVAVAKAAGLWATHLDGRPLVYNQLDPNTGDLLVCHTNLVGRVSEILSGR